MYDQKERLAPRITRFLKVKKGWASRRKLVQEASSNGYSPNQILCAFDFLDTRVEIRKKRDENWNVFYKYDDGNPTNQEDIDNFEKWTS